MEHTHPSYAHMPEYHLGMGSSWIQNFMPKAYTIAQTCPCGPEPTNGNWTFYSVFPLGRGGANGTGCSRQKGFPKPVVSDRF